MYGDEMDNALYNSWLVESGDQTLKVPLLQQQQDGTFKAADLDTLASLANANGLTGAPYKFELDTVNGSFIFPWATELVRMRTALFKKATVAIDSTQDYPGYRKWALVGVPRVLFNTQQPTDSVTFDGQFFTQRYNELPRYIEPEFIFRAAADGETPTKVRGGMFIEGSIGKAGTTAEFRVTTNGTTHKILPQASFDLPPFDFFGKIEITWRLTAPSETADMPAYVVEGRTDLFRIKSIVVEKIGPFTSVDRKATITIEPIPDHVLQERESIYFNIRILNPDQFQFISTDPSSPRQGVSGFNVRMWIGEEKTESADAAARVIHPTRMDWRRLAFDVTDLGIEHGDGNTEKDINARLITNGTLNLCTILCRWVEGRTVEVVTGRTVADGYWRAKSAPVSSLVTAAIRGTFDRYKAARPNDSDVRAWGIIGAGFANADAAKSIVRAADANLERKAYQDDNRTPIDLAVGTTPAKTWADFDVCEVTIPQQLQGPATFDLPDVPADQPTGATTTTCKYYKVRLPVGREHVRTTTWDSNKTVDQAKSYSSENYTDLFHDARVTSQDGGTFWYRDLFTRELDFARTQLHFSHWLIKEENDNLYLYLLLDEKTVTVKTDEHGGRANVQKQFWPIQTISSAMFKAAWGEARGAADTGVIERTFGNNETEFQSPFRFFSTSPTAPIATWTVGLKTGGAWQPGTRLRVHLPRNVSKDDVVVFEEHWLEDLTGLSGDVVISGPSLAAPRGIGINYYKNSGAEIGTVDLKGPSYSYLSGFTQADKWTEIYDFDARLSLNRRELLVLKNGTAKLSYYPVAGLKLHRVVQIHSDSFLNEYPDTKPSDWRDDSFAVWQEIYPDDYSVATDGTVTFRASIGNFGSGETLRDASDEIQFVIATYSTAQGLPGSNAQIAIGVPNASPDATDIFNEWGRLKFQSTMDIRAPFLNGTVDGNTMDQRWIRDKDWPIAYRRILASVDVTIETEGHHYNVRTGLDGILAYAVAPEDCTVRYQTTFTGFKADNTTFTRTFTTEQPVLKGRHLLPPRLIATLAEDDTLSAEELATMRMTSCTFVSARQLWSCRVKIRECNIGATVGPTIVGLPLLVHLNETRRLLQAWVDHKAEVP